MDAVPFAANPDRSHQVVFDAVREANCERWLVWDENGKGWIYLGDLPPAGTERPEQWDFLARLLHYAIIRTNLREARAARR